MNAPIFPFTFTDWAPFFRAHISPAEVHNDNDDGGGGGGDDVGSGITCTM